VAQKTKPGKGLPKAKSHLPVPQAKAGLPVKAGALTPLAEARKDLDGFYKRIEAGDPSTLPAVREALKNEHMRELLSLGYILQNALARQMFHNHTLASEAVMQELKILHSELAGPSPSPLERVLVQRAVICWLWMQDADLRYANARQQEGGLDLDLHEAHQRRQDRAHRRFLSAVRTLALVRKLALPAVQVNIGGQQVNTMAATPARRPV
jgi:hypothetical protein